jgi:hypothetical protein
MSRDFIPPPFRPRLPLTNPWPLLGTALAAAVLAMLVRGFAPQASGLRLLLMIVGLLLALGAVGVRLRTIQEDAEDRFRGAGVLALASAVPFLAYLSLYWEWDSIGMVWRPEWDSFGMLLRVAVGVGLAGAGLLLLPRVARRLTLVFLVLFHFGGILSAVGSPAPPNGQQSWLINQLWVGFYRPYLHFCYLNNAYHFYSPDPGPPMLLWFRIEYEGGKSRWVEIPSLAEARSKLAFQRRLALTESVNQLKSQTPYDFDTRLLNRVEAGQTFRNGSIPLMNDANLPRTFEYREPVPYAKQLLKSYARYVLSHYPCEDDPDLSPKKVKIYRVIHAIPDQSQVALGSNFNAYDPTTYLPYYQGEFDTTGKLLDGPEYKDGVIVKRGDPFLYWLIPIKHELKEGYQPRQGPDGKFLPPGPNDMRLADYLKVHAGDRESFWERKQGEAGPGK